MPPTGDELNALVEQSDVWADHVEDMAEVLELSQQESQPAEALTEEVELPTSDATRPGTAETATPEGIESEAVATVEESQETGDEVREEAVDSAPQETDIEINAEVVAEAKAMFADRESDTISFETSDASMPAGVSRAVGAQAEIYVIREDTIYVHAMDVDGNELNGASVYIAWNDENGKKHEYQTTTTTTNGHIGYAEIPGMKGIHSGFISVAKSGYRIYTQLNADLKGGSMLTYALTHTQQYEIYPRAVALDGIDIVNSSCDLTLVSSSTDAYDLTVLMAGTDVGRNDFPAPVIHAENDADGVYLNQIEPTDQYYYNYPGDTPGTNTVTYTFRKRWSEKLEGNDTVLRDGDKLSLCYGDKVQTLNVNVEEAVCTAQWLDGFSLNLIGGEGASFKISESVPLIGGDSLSAECLDLKVTLIISPGGKVIAGYGSNIGEYINKEDFLGKAYEPSTDKKFEGITSSIQNAYAKRKDMLKQGKAFLAGSSKGTHFVDTAAEVDVRVEALGMGRYDRSTGYLTFDLSAIVSVMGQFSVTSYYLIPAPVYFGLEVNPSVSLDGTIGMRFKPTNITGTFGFSSSTRLEVDIALAMTAFAGVGLRGVMGAEVTGTIGVDIPIVLYGADNPPPGHSYPHVRGDASFTIGLTAYFLMFRYRHTFFDTGVKLFDTWDDSKARLSTSNVEMQTERYDLDFEGAAENETAVANSGAELSETTSNAAPDTDIITETTLDADNYANGNTPALAQNRFALIDGETKAATDVFKSDNLVAVTSGDGKGYLFRQTILKGSNGKSTPHVVFQEILDAGGLSAQSYTVPMPGDYDTVYSFSAMVNHNEKYETSRNFVYIAMRIGHSGLTDLDARAIDSRVCTVVLDLNDRHVVKPPYVYERATEGYFSYMGTPQVYGGSGNPVAACLTSTNYKDEKPTANGYEAFSNAAWRGSKAKDFRTGYAKLPIDNLTIAGSSNPTLSGSTIKILYSYENQLIGDDFYFNFGGFLETKFHDYYPARISNLAYPNVGDVVAGNEDLSSPYLVSGGTLYKLDQYLHGQKMDCVTESGLDFGFAGGDSSVSYFHAKGSANLQLVSVRQGVDTEEDANGKLVRSTPYSTVTVYNALKNSEGKYVMYGPQEYRIDGRNMLHATGLMKDEYTLKLFYTADEQTYVTDKPTGVYGTAEYKDGTLRETCDLYTFDVGRDYNADVVALASDKPFIQQTDGTVALTLAVKNQCSRPISRFTLLVEDDAGRKVYEGEHLFELQPGQTRQLTINPKILSAWSGATTLTAKITRAGDDMQFFVNSTQGDSYKFEIPSISVFASVISHKSGTVFSSGSSGTNVLSAATFGADTSSRAATTPVVESNDSMTVNLQLSNASIVPAENMRAEIYRWNGYGEIMDGTEENPEPVYAYQIGTLSETSMGGMDTSVNMYLPLDDAWFDPFCGEIEVRVVGDGIEPTSTWVTNPSGGPMDFVITAPDDEFYGTTEGDGMYFLGQEVTVTATPKHGYVFDCWINSEDYGKDDPLVLSTDASYTFNMECNVSFIAMFKEDGTAHEVVLSPYFDQETEAMGTVEMDGYPLEPGFFNIAYRVDHGATVHLRAKPYAGYEFVRWVDFETEATLSTTAEFDYTVDHAVFLCAVFRELPEVHYEPVRTEFENKPHEPENKQEDSASEVTQTPTPTAVPTGKIPQTSDPFNITLWLGLMAIGLAGTLYFRKKSKK